MSPIGTFSQLRPGHDVLPLEQQHAIRALQGVPAPLIDIRIVDEAGREQPFDGSAVGEVQVRGPWITGGYHNAPRDLTKISADGWLRTGDMGVINSDGYLRLVDRSKDLIKSGGEWISSVDLENAVMAHPGIAEAAVVAVKHPKWDERPLVVAVRKND